MSKIIVIKNKNNKNNTHNNNNNFVANSMQFSFKQQPISKKQTN